MVAENQSKNGGGDEGIVFCLKTSAYLHRVNDCTDGLLRRLLSRGSRRTMAHMETASTCRVEESRFLQEKRKKEGQHKCDYHAWQESVLRARLYFPSLRQNRSETATDRITGLSVNMTRLTDLKFACVCHCEAIIRVRLRRSARKQLATAASHCSCRGMHEASPKGRSGWQTKCPLKSFHDVKVAIMCMI